jgi:hypothetical protein
MAKKTAKAELPAPVPVELSKAVQTAIDNLKPQFTAYAQGFAALQVSREELAPKFMRAFGKWQAETGSTFVNFVRLFDATIGPKREDYRNHRAFQAADYLRRLVAGTTAKQQPEGVAGTPPAATPLDAAAMAIATVLSLVPEDQLEALWKAVGIALNWSERQVSTLQHRAETASPLVLVKFPKADLAHVRISAA